MTEPARPSEADLQAAYGRTVPDLVRPGLAALLCGINPSLWSGAVGLHFATPGNRLWPALHTAGWTSHRLLPWETDEVLAAGIGITNLVPRATARADELTDDELREGLPRPEALAAPAPRRGVRRAPRSSAGGGCSTLLPVIHRGLPALSGHRPT